MLTAGRLKVSNLFLSVLRSGTLPLFLVLPVSIALAETAIDEKLLGLTAQTLKESIPAITKAVKPMWGPHGVRGLWLLNNTKQYGQIFNTTFFFKVNRIERIEHRQISTDAQCAVNYTSMISSLEGIYGQAVKGAGTDLTVDGSRSAGWVLVNFKVMAYKLQDSSRCELLVAFEPHQEKDASSL